ncbi:TetR/AcrR family transcriptional regulator [Pseudonocardia ammonioxydans]|uniref:TetR/AcrR family transcriptional regulator n=1 Tax=Pseudonocardia ammonioxydans TaxID=260086 RepID=UPI0015A59DCB|nr:TetR/AcrR family transcriptional regulator [Pseudonocardia ammonioxydans]
MALLWRRARPRGQRGPRPSLDVDTVVAAALRLADRDGIEGVSMRAVARELGVGTMSLYPYIADKATLLALMVDTVYLQMPRGPLQHLHWRERLVRVADANLALLADHPWIDCLVSTQLPPGPGVMAKYEHELSAFDDLGLPDIAVDDCLTLLLVFVQGVGRAATAAEPTHSGEPADARGWGAIKPDLTDWSDWGNFARAVRIGAVARQASAKASGSARAYRSGLAVLTEGIAAVAAQTTDESEP